MAAGLATIPPPGALIHAVLLGGGQAPRTADVQLRMGRAVRAVRSGGRGTRPGWGRPGPVDAAGTLCPLVRRR
ncbi:hypothetical protein Axi01nite_05140 [Actinoplanes xinjiangensis]|nr:hypothetical protein Axi01nite_05140 [Actinoplanes xinjiangensis]